MFNSANAFLNHEISFCLLNPGYLRESQAIPRHEQNGIERRTGKRSCTGREIYSKYACSSCAEGQQSEAGTKLRFSFRPIVYPDHEGRGGNFTAVPCLILSSMSKSSTDWNTYFCFVQESGERGEERKELTPETAGGRAAPSSKIDPHLSTKSVRVFFIWVRDECDGKLFCWSADELKETKSRTKYISSSMNGMDYGST